MANQGVIAVVPSKQHHIYISGQGEERDFVEPNEAFDWLAANRNAGVVAVMGGPGQEFFARVAETGTPVFRVPMFRLQQEAGVESKDSAPDRAVGLQLLWETDPDAFYAFADVDPDNSASRRLLERLGFLLEGILREEWETHIGVRDTALYGLLKEERPWQLPI